MAPRLVIRNREKVSSTVDAGVMEAVHKYVAATPSAHLSQVLDEALMLWLAKQQEQAMIAQFTAPQSPTEKDERAAWKRIPSKAATRTFKKRAGN